MPQRQQLRLSGPGGDETVPIDGPLIAHDIAFAVDAAAIGIGISLVPDAYFGWAMKGGLRTGWKSLVRLLPDFFIGPELSLVSPPVAYEPARVGLFRDFLAERLRPLMRGCAAAVQQERAQRREAPGALSPESDALLLGGAARALSAALASPPLASIDVAVIVYMMVTLPPTFRSPVTLVSLVRAICHFSLSSGR